MESPAAYYYKCTYIGSVVPTEPPYDWNTILLVTFVAMGQIFAAVFSDLTIDYADFRRPVLTA